MSSEVFKVVRTRDDGYFSSSAHALAGVRYFIDEWSIAPLWLRKRGYHLTAFESVETATAWFEYIEDDPLTGCHVRDLEDALEHEPVREVVLRERLARTQPVTSEVALDRLRAEVRGIQLDPVARHGQTASLYEGRASSERSPRSPARKR